MSPIQQYPQHTAYVRGELRVLAANAAIIQALVDGSSGLLALDHDTAAALVVDVRRIYLRPLDVTDVAEVRSEVFASTSDALRALDSAQRLLDRHMVELAERDDVDPRDIHTAIRSVVALAGARRVAVRDAVHSTVPRDVAKGVSRVSDDDFVAAGQAALR